MANVVELSADLVNGVSAGDLGGQRKTPGRSTWMACLVTWTSTPSSLIPIAPAYQFTGGWHSGDTTSGVTLLAMSGIELLSLVIIVGIEESIKAFRT